jgi:hypothetical protein
VSLAKIPPFVVVFFVIDLGLGATYVIDYLAGRPSWLLSTLLDLGEEENVPTWYASAQWFVVAILPGNFVYHILHRFYFRSWLLLPPLNGQKALRN